MTVESKKEEKKEGALFFAFFAFVSIHLFVLKYLG